MRRWLAKVSIQAKPAAVQEGGIYQGFMPCFLIGEEKKKERKKKALLLHQRQFALYWQVGNASSQQGCSAPSWFLNEQFVLPRPAVWLAVFRVPVSETERLLFIEWKAIPGRWWREKFWWQHWTKTPVFLGKYNGICNGDSQQASPLLRAVQK